MPARVATNGCATAGIVAAWLSNAIGRLGELVTRVKSRAGFNAVDSAEATEIQAALDALKREATTEPGRSMPRRRRRTSLSRPKKWSTPSVAQRESKRLSAVTPNVSSCCRTGAGRGVDRALGGCDPGRCGADRGTAARHGNRAADRIAARRARRQKRRRRRPGIADLPRGSGRSLPAGRRSGARMATLARRCRRRAAGAPHAAHIQGQRADGRRPCASESSRIGWNRGFPPANCTSRRRPSCSRRSTPTSIGSATCSMRCAKARRTSRCPMPSKRSPQRPHPRRDPSGCRRRRCNAPGRREARRRAARAGQGGCARGRRSRDRRPRDAARACRHHRSARQRGRRSGDYTRAHRRRAARRKRICSS